MTTYRTGYTTLTLERRAYLQTLYDQLGNKSKIVEGSRVSDIIEEDESVRVVLDNGTVHVGDLVVGADGVHSKVRELMWKNANESIPGFISAAEKRCKRGYHPTVDYIRPPTDISPTKPWSQPTMPSSHTRLCSLA